MFLSLLLDIVEAPMTLCVWELKGRGSDPKDGELCLGRLKPGEIPVEGRRCVDVQITCMIWVKGRKTHRTV